MRRNPECVSCELRCELTAAKGQIVQAITEVGSPVEEANFRADIAQYDVKEDDMDVELREMVGQTGFDDPEASLQEATKSYEVAGELCDALVGVGKAQNEEASSKVLNFGPDSIRYIDRDLRQLSNNEQYCPGQKRGFAVPGIGFIALGFGSSKRCGSSYAPIARRTLNSVQDILPE